MSLAERFQDLQSEKEHFVTAPQVFSQLIKSHPEILQISFAAYPQKIHGSGPDEYWKELYPLVVVEDDLVRGIWPKRRFNMEEVVAMGSVVGVCANKRCHHTDKEHCRRQDYLWEQFHDCDSLPEGKQMSFIFLDIEYHGPGVLGRILQALEKVETNWFVLSSRNGYHVVLDKMVDLDSLAKKYGEVIANFGTQLNDDALIGWGKSLVKGANNHRQVKIWCEDVLEQIGHIDEPNFQMRKEVHLIDLRHVAHSLERTLVFQDWIHQNRLSSKFRPRTSPTEIGGAFLRISPKEDSLPPILVAKKGSGKIEVLEKIDQLFSQSDQMPLF